MQTGRVGQNGSMRRPGSERGLGGVSPSPLVARAKGRILPLDLQLQDCLPHSERAEAGEDSRRQAKPVPCRPAGERLRVVQGASWEREAAERRWTIGA